MAFIQLCDRDPLLTMLHDFFGANTVRVPDGRIQPLSVIAHIENQSFFRGALEPLLVGEQPIAITPVTSPVADLSGQRSRRVAVDLGLFLLRGILAGMGIPSTGLSSKLEGVSHLSFSFPGVQRSALDINRFGQALAGRQLNRTNPAGEIFFGDNPHQLLIIDSILTSNRISINLGAKEENKLQVDVPGIQQLVANSGSNVSFSDAPDYQLTFESTRDLTFAFSCIRTQYDADGVIQALQPDLRARTLSGDTSTVLEREPVSHVLIGGGPGLLVFQG